jgi:uncharacterized damage-inducible protein DinB
MNCDYLTNGCFMLISELMTHELASEMVMTRRLLARIPDESLLWQPPGELHSIAWNATHLAEIVGWVPGILEQSEWDIAPIDGEAYVVSEITATSKLLEAFDEHSENALHALQGVPDAVMDEPWSLKMGGQTIFTMNKGACLRKWVFGHLAHHRGILSVYLRMAGLQFPSIYEA